METRFMGDIGQSLKLGWQTMKTNFWFFLVLLIAVGVISSLLQGIAEKAQNVATIFVLINIVFTVIYRMGFIRIFLNYVDNDEVDAGTVFSCIPLFFKFIAGTILFALAVAGAPALTMILYVKTMSPIFAIASAALVILSIVYAIRFSFYGWLIIDEELGPVEALRVSAEITDGIKWDLLGFYIVIGIINMLGAMVLGIGLLATIPATGVAMAFVYRNLIGETKVPVAQGTIPPEKIINARKSPYQP